MIFPLFDIFLFPVPLQLSPSSCLCLLSYFQSHIHGTNGSFESEILTPSWHHLELIHFWQIKGKCLSSLPPLCPLHPRSCPGSPPIFCSWFSLELGYVSRIQLGRQFWRSNKKPGVWRKCLFVKKHVHACHFCPLKSSSPLSFISSLQLFPWRLSCFPSDGPHLLLHYIVLYFQGSNATECLCSVGTQGLCMIIQ